MGELRRTVLVSSVAVAGAGLMLALTFGVLLEPGQAGDGSCRTGLYPGDYADLLLPMYLVALAVLLVALAALSRRLGHKRAAAIVLPAAAIYVGACIAYPPVFGPYGLVAMILSIPAVVTLAIALPLQVAAARREPSDELRWARLARASWAGQWTALIVLLPGAYAYAWLSGAGVFCF
jgi:hypothetical protein